MVLRDASIPPSRPHRRGDRLGEHGRVRRVVPATRRAAPHPGVRAAFRGPKRRRERLLECVEVGCARPTGDRRRREARPRALPRLLKSPQSIRKQRRLGLSGGAHSLGTSPGQTSASAVDRRSPLITASPCRRRRVRVGRRFDGIDDFKDRALQQARRFQLLIVMSERKAAPIDSKGDLNPIAGRAALTFSPPEPRCGFPRGKRRLRWRSRARGGPASARGKLSSPAALARRNRREPVRSRCRSGRWSRVGDPRTHRPVGAQGWPQRPAGLQCVCYHQWRETVRPIDDAAAASSPRVPKHRAPAGRIRGPSGRIASAADRDRGAARAHFAGAAVRSTSAWNWN